MADIINTTADDVAAINLSTASPASDATQLAIPQPPPIQQRSCKTFDDLSTDLKTSVIEHVLRPSDLKNVCLVSSELHEIAVRFLYRNVSLDLGSTNDCRLSAFLNHKNKGLKYVRQIRLYLANPPARCGFQEQQATFATRMILEFLPENILEEFSWCPWRPFSADNLMLLYKKQKNMKWLEVMDLDRDVLDELKKDSSVTSGIFERSRKLALYPENIPTLDTAGYYIERSAQELEELIIHANFTTPEDGDTSRSVVDQRELNDTATGPGLLTRTLFSKMLPFEECTPFGKLTSLRLHRINLRYAADTWCKVVNFKQCRNLRFYHCPGVDSMLGQLCKASNLPLELRTLELQHKDNHENEALLALDGFLCIVKGLKEIILDIHSVKTLPDTAGICKQGRTLEILNLHASGESSSPIPPRAELTDADEHFYMGEDFEKICKSCPRLVQLSCAWPPTSLIRGRSDEWKTYEAAMSEHLRELVTLHITTWPNNKPSSQLLPRHIFEHLLQGLATRLYESSLRVEPESSTLPGKLRVVAFGIHDKIYEREDSINQVSYVRSSALDAEGNPKVHAAQIGWCLRQYVEPRSEVLDTVLGREIRPPVRPDGREFALDDADGWDDEV